MAGGCLLDKPVLQDCQLDDANDLIKKSKDCRCPGLTKPTNITVGTDQKLIC